MKKTVCMALFAVSISACAQNAAAPVSQQPPTHGKVIFSRSDDASATQDQSADPTAHDVVAAIALSALTDSQRDAVTVTHYALDVHLARQTPRSLFTPA